MGRGAMWAVRRGGRLRVDVRHVIDRPLHPIVRPARAHGGHDGLRGGLERSTRKATTDVAAYSALGPMALGAGRSHATSARIVNIGTSLGVPQGQLSAERNALNALIKVVAPTLYATLFTFGSKRARSACPSS